MRGGESRGRSYFPCIAYLMKVKRVTNMELAAVAGVSYATVHRAKHGHRIVTSHATWMMIALNSIEAKRSRNAMKK